MDIEAFLADAVQASGGKLHALGIGWQVIQTTAFPARHDRIGIGLIVRTVAAEAGQHTLTLTLLDPEGAARSFLPVGASEATCPPLRGPAPPALPLPADRPAFYPGGGGATVLGRVARRLTRL